MIMFVLSGDPALRKGSVKNFVNDAEGRELIKSLKQ